MNFQYPEGYIGSTRAELAHRSVNNLDYVRLVAKKVPHPADFAEIVASHKAGFIAGLSRAVKESRPVFGGVTHHNLSEVIDLADSLDWTDQDALQQLADKCSELLQPLG